MAEEKWAELLAIGPNRTDWEARSDQRDKYVWGMEELLKLWSNSPASDGTHILFVSESGVGAIITPGNPATVKYYPDLDTARVAMELLR